MDNFIASSFTELFLVFGSVTIYGFWRLIKALAAAEVIQQESQQVLNQSVPKMQADIAMLQGENRKLFSQILLLQSENAQLREEILQLKIVVINPLKDENATQSKTITALKRQLMECKESNGLRA